MTWQTPEWPINMMVTTRIRNDGVLAPMLGGLKTYDSAVGEVARPKPYVLLPTDAGTLGNLFGAKGRNVVCEWHIVGENKEQCNRIFNELMRLFDRQELPLEDFTMVRGSLTSSFGLDEEDLSGYRKICEYAVHALQASV